MLRTNEIIYLSITQISSDILDINGIEKVPLKIIQQELIKSNPNNYNIKK